MKQLIALSLLFIGSTANAVTYNIAALESLSSGGDSKAFALNDNGTVVGQSYNSTSGQLESVIWSGGIVQSLGVSGIARGINNSGVVVGETGSASLAIPDGYAYSWTSGGGISNLGTLGGSYSGAYDINESGVITGHSWIANPNGVGYTEGFVYKNGNMTSLGTVSSPTGYSRGHGINDAGEIVGRASLVDFGNSNKYAAYWEADGTINSFVGPGTYSSASRINNNGVIVGNGRMPGANQQFAMIWDENGNSTFLGTFGGTTSRALSLNDAGEIVGSAQDANGDNKAMISYDGSTIVDLNTLVDLTGTDFINLTYAYDINASGQIVGIGTRSTGEQAAFILTAVPLPAAVWLFMSALGLLGWTQRQRSR